MNDLRTYRKLKKITQSDFAELVEVQQGTISRIENGELPSLYLACKIEEVTRGKVKAASWINSGSQHLASSPSDTPQAGVNS